MAAVTENHSNRHVRLADLLNDIDKEIVMADIIGWLDVRAPKA